MAIERLHRLLRELDVVALAVVAESSRDPDLAAFVVDAHLGGSLLILPRGQQPVLAYLTSMERQEAGGTGLDLLHPAELKVEQARRESRSDAEFRARVLERGLGLCGVAPGRVALAGRIGAGLACEMGSLLERRGWHPVSGNETLRRWRKCKTPWQLESARRAMTGVDRSMHHVAELLAHTVPRDDVLWLEGEPLRAGRLRREIASCLASLELCQPDGNIVAAGGAAAVPHTKGESEQILAPGQAIVVDLYPSDLLYADCARTFCVGEVPPALMAAHAAVLGALHRVQHGVKVGITGWELQFAACEQLAAAGYDTILGSPEATTGYVHGVGHGVGFELHEYPSFRQDSGEAGILEVGDLFTLEPGLYDPKAGYGVRLEDLCYLAADGLEILSRLPYHLDPRAWHAGGSA